MTVFVSYFRQPASEARRCCVTIQFSPSVRSGTGFRVRTVRRVQRWPARCGRARVRCQRYPHRPSLTAQGAVLAVRVREEVWSRKYFRGFPLPTPTPTGPRLRASSPMCSKWRKVLLAWSHWANMPAPRFTSMGAMPPMTATSSSARLPSSRRNRLHGSEFGSRAAT